MLRQILSEPALRHEFIHGGDEAPPKESREKWREGLADIMQHLDQQCAVRKKDQNARMEMEAGVARMRAQQRRALAEKNRPDWNYPEPMDLFTKEIPSINKCEASMKVAKPTMTQAQREEQEALTRFEKGWMPRASNDRGCELDEFGTKARQRMYPTEKKFADRLDKQLAKAQKLTAQDSLAKTDGRIRKQRMLNNPDSILNRNPNRVPWNEQLVSNQVCFSEPEPDPVGSQGGVGLSHYVTQPERTTSFERDFVAGGCDMTSHWRPPAPGMLTGSMKCHSKARALLNPRGCPALLEDDGHRKAARDPHHPVEIFRRLEKQRAADMAHWRSSSMPQLSR